MTERDDGVLGVPDAPILDRIAPHGAGRTPAIPPRRRRRQASTGHRLMVVLGLTVQAIVIGLILAGAFVFEEPLRRAVGLERPALDATIERLEARITELEARLAADAEARRLALGEDLAALGDRLAALEDADGRTEAAARLAVVERLVSRVEAKVDDLRDAELFPIAPTEAGR